jgi:hypothetical protein
MKLNLKSILEAESILIELISIYPMRTSLFNRNILDAILIDLEEENILI